MEAVFASTATTTKMDMAIVFLTALKTKSMSMDSASAPMATRESLVESVCPLVATQAPLETQAIVLLGLSTFMENAPPLRHVEPTSIGQEPSASATRATTS